MVIEIKNLKKGDKFKWYEKIVEVCNFEDLPKDYSIYHEKHKADYIWFKYQDGECNGLTPNTKVEVISSAPIMSQNAPRNNDGRTTCFWCNINTQKRGGGLYDVCPKCGR